MRLAVGNNNGSEICFSQFNYSTVVVGCCITAFVLSTFVSEKLTRTGESRLDTFWWQKGLDSQVQPFGSALEPQSCVENASQKCINVFKETDRATLVRCTRLSEIGWACSSFWVMGISRSMQTQCFFVNPSVFLWISFLQRWGMCIIGPNTMCEVAYSYQDVSSFGAQTKAFSRSLSFSTNKVFNRIHVNSRLSLQTSNSSNALQSLFPPLNGYNMFLGCSCLISRWWREDTPKFSAT